MRAHHERAALRAWFRAQWASGEGEGCVAMRDCGARGQGLQRARSKEEKRVRKNGSGRMGASRRWGEGIEIEVLRDMERGGFGV
jgi:hypothetical protein